jgi:hypothetical protein
VLVFLSQHSVANRGYVPREVKLALDTLEDVSKGEIHTIPIRLDECAVPELFHDLQWCDLFEEDGFERLVHAIRVGLSQRQQPLVPRLTNSIGGFDSAAGVRPVPRCAGVTLYLAFSTIVFRSPAGPNCCVTPVGLAVLTPQALTQRLLASLGRR